jgi:cell division inhibitor SepF
MAGAMRKVAVYLGLADDQYRDGYGDGYAEYDDQYGEYEEYPEGDHGADREPGTVTPLSSASSNHRAAAQQTAVSPSRVVTDASQIAMLVPNNYNDARLIGESFRDGVPVIINLGDMDRGDAKRLVDFAAGLVFGLKGSLERIDDKVFLLKPDSVTVTTEERKRLASADFYNQS